MPYVCLSTRSSRPRQCLNVLWLDMLLIIRSTVPSSGGVIMRRMDAIDILQTSSPFPTPIRDVRDRFCTPDDSPHVQNITVNQSRSLIWNPWMLADTTPSTPVYWPAFLTTLQPSNFPNIKRVCTSESCPHPPVKVLKLDWGYLTRPLPLLSQIQGDLAGTRSVWQPTAAAQAPPAPCCTAPL
jgi:hypothetical protein